MNQCSTSSHSHWFNLPPSLHLPYGDASHLWDLTIQLIWLSGRREVQNLSCRNLSFPVSSSPMQVQILNTFSHSNAGKPLSCQRTDNTECHNNLLTLEAAHHGHRWHFHRPSWLMHLLSLLPLLLLVSIQRYWGYRSLSATCMHLVLSKCRQLFVHSFDGRKSLSLSLVLEHLK